MKRPLILFFAGTLACAVCAPLNESSAQTTKTATATKAAAWDYPVKPGTPEWEKFTNRFEMVEAIQVPDDILNALTTKELVEVCLNYPMFADIFAYSSLQDGLRQNIVVCSNGVRELYRRPDNAQCLLDVLKANDLLEIESSKISSTKINSTALLNGYEFLSLAFLETLMSHESVLTNADARQLRDIAAVAARNMLIKERGFYRLYSRHSLGASAYLLGAILKMENVITAPSPDLDHFLKTGWGMYDTLFVEELMNNYVKF